MLNVSQIRKDFPILKRKINGKPLIYLDNAATTQKPQAVIDAIVDYYTNHNANIHRGIHTLAEEATGLYESARKKIADFFGAKSEKEIIFVRNSTEAINLVAYSYARSNLTKGDEIILTQSEHHSNLVPWQMIAKEKGAILRFIRTKENGFLDLTHFQKLLSPKTKIVSIVHISNVLGIINPVEEIADMSHQFGAKVLVDGSQSAPRMPINLQNLKCDFFAVTGHKMAGPTGIGILWGREEILAKMPPFLGGGDMIKKVSFERFIPNDLPYKFEAGTPNIADTIGFGAAIDYLDKLGMENIFEHEKKLTDYALKCLNSISGLIIYGPKFSQKKVGVIAFNIKGIHPHDLAQILDADGIAIRSGFHCAMPYHREILHTTASARISFYIYNTLEEIDLLVKSLERAKKIFHG